MKLSEAIRLGAMLKPQSFYFLRDDLLDRTCALGAACDAVGALDERDLRKIFPYLRKCFASPFPLTKHKRRLLTTIVKLNDEIRWTRERIADWVETLEPAEELSSAQEPEKVCVE